MDNSSYELNSNVSIIASDNMLGNYDINKMTFEIKSKNNPAEQLWYANANFKYGNNDIITFHEIKDGNKFAVKSDDIVVKYLGVNLDNINGFLAKLGFTAFDQIPSDYNAL